MPQPERPYTQILRDQPERVVVDETNPDRRRHFARVGGALRWATFVVVGEELVQRGEQGRFREKTPFQLTSGARLGFIERANE